MRLLPRSLLGQVMLALAAALLIAQAISATMLYRAATERREFALTSMASFQLLIGQRRVLRDDRPRRGGRPRLARPQIGEQPFLRLPRRIRYSQASASPLLPGETRDPAREDAIAAQLERQGVEVAEIVAFDRALAADPLLRQLGEVAPRWAQRLREAPHELLVVGLRREGSETWQVARLAVPPPDRSIVRTLVLQTLLLFLVLVGLLYFVLRRITRPLHALAERTRRFGSAGAPEEPLAASGPDDVRRLIEAHNAMQARIGSMLDEKDVMLGAIGHDLKTPLAALRVRIESVEDAAARDKMAATIEDITRTLDEILSLARIGRSDTPPEMTELGALAASVVEEFEDMGRPVTLEVGGRIAAPVHLTWLKRGLRNLVTNALRYGGNAQVSVLREDGMAVLRVEDEGPGIPEARIAEMLEPFTRGEASRNRETGGAGLGLTLARAVAEQHGGTLRLVNRAEGGLRAEIRLST
ncbi:ATP-binding protein [Erythrobacter sp.]|uniref:ATP-binding protein n=1 Tax=Erythrobacter sp. TaxID=1042 RepID=UPI001B26170F|nr:ATP-binding protein [Erythrobacter sp.]MBO6527608.1 HAMP domain-containing protein [Erythrobacter sp.]MBO6530137.1 HAMP domain-containing protein [Erythrobacter sp.]